MQGQLDESTRQFLQHIIKHKEKAIESGFYGMARSLCKIHEQVITNYITRHGITK
jgi:hypothetical protein